MKKSKKGPIEAPAEIKAAMATAIAWISEHQKDKDGCICPCCNLLLKERIRPLNKHMAETLVAMYVHFYKNPREEWLHVTNFAHKVMKWPHKKTTDFAKMKYWDLIEAKEEVRADGSSRAGLWKLTEKGRQFVEGQITVAEKKIVFNDQCCGETGKQVNISDCLGIPFDYQVVCASTH